MRDHLGVIKKRLVLLQDELLEEQKRNDDIHRAGRILLGILMMFGEGKTATKEMQREFKWAAKVIGRP